MCSKYGVHVTFEEVVCGTGGGAAFVAGPAAGATFVAAGGAAFGATPGASPRWDSATGATPGVAPHNNQKIKVRARKVSDDAETLIRRVHELGLAEMIAGLPSQKEAWMKYREKHGGDFSQGRFLLLIARSEGFAYAVHDSIRRI